MTTSRLPALLALLAISGCSDPLSEACGGQRPELSECFRGAYFAECGGDRAGATIACAELGCLWFSGACIAEGYRPIECPVSDVCCHPSVVWDGRQRHWPYEDDWAAEYDPSIDLAILSGGPITATSPGVPVTIDPSTSPPASSELSCSGSVELASCIGAPAHFRGARTVGDAWVLEIQSGAMLGEILQLEVLPAPSGELVARLFVREFTDIGSDAPICRTEGSARTPAGQTGGVTLSSFSLDDPSSVHGEAEISLTEGPGTITIRF